MTVKKKISRKKTTRAKKKSTAKSVGTRKSLIGVDPLAFMAADDMATLRSDNEVRPDLAKATAAVDADNDAILKIETSQEIAEDVNVAQAQNDEPELAESCVIDLGDHLSIRETASLYKQLNELSADRFVLDASKIDKVDTAGLQLLTLFIQHAEKECQSVTWRSPDENLCHAADLLGLTEELRLA